MLLIWKNKGILVMLYVIVSFIGTAMLVGILHRNAGGIFSQIDFYTTIGIAFLIAAAWTYRTKDDYYKDRYGNKKKMDTVHEFFFIKMGTWVFIFLCAALIFLGNLVFNYFSPADL